MALRRLAPAELEARGYGRRSERFLDTATGETVSRRQAQNVTLRAEGWSSRAEYERVMSDRRARDAAAHLVGRDRADTGRRQPLGRLIGPQTDFAKNLRAAARGGWKRTARGAWAHALVLSGQRSPSDRFRVGFSPNSPRLRRRGRAL